ncbi:hypothetical protein KCU78_g2116, partial [Aureobasidium melanogenum]
MICRGTSPQPRYYTPQTGKDIDGTEWFISFFDDRTNQFVPLSFCLIMRSTATVNAYTVASVGTSIPNSLAI